jgi:cysteinyl-tRNA synthetase
MSKAFLGSSFDIHGGGRDLVFPHHENEIAQSESANEKSYASYWIHSGLLTIDKQKMSKSLGNHLTIRDFLKSWHPEVLRLSFIERHYSSNIDFSAKVFAHSRRRLLYFYETLQHLETRSAKDIPNQGNTQAKMPFDPKEFRDEFHKAMSDDFNTAAAIVAINRLFRLSNQLISEKPSAINITTTQKVLSLIRELASALGLFQNETKNTLDQLKRQVLPELGISEEDIVRAIIERSIARQSKQWEQSDRIRDELLAKGITLCDDVNTTTWSIKNHEE